MAFGKKSRSLKDMRKKMKDKGSGGNLMFISEDGILIRFMEEPEEWMRYNEAWSDAMRTSWPIPEGEDAGMHDARVSVRYLANVLDIENDKIRAVKLPITLVDLLSARAEKRGSVSDIDMVLYKTGEGKNTSYAFDLDEKKKRNLSKYELLDLEAVLQGEYDRVWADDDDDDEDDEEESPRPQRRGSSKRRPASVQEDDDEEEEDLDDDEEEEEEYDDDEEEEDLDDEDEDEEDEDDEDEDEDGDEDEFWSEADLKAMTLGELRKLAKEYDIDAVGLKKSELVDALLG